VSDPPYTRLKSLQQDTAEVLGFVQGRLSAAMQMHVVSPATHVRHVHATYLRGLRKLDSRSTRRCTSAASRANFASAANLYF